jgi:Mor family transcriptional regulator
MNKIALARTLIEEAGFNIDIVLEQLKVSHSAYRRQYPDTPVSPGLALLVMDDKDVYSIQTKQLQKKWNLTNSQLNYALYNPSALNPPTTPKHELVRQQILCGLREGRTQTEVAQKVDMSQSYVHKIAKEAGLLPDNRKQRTVLSLEQKAEIIRDFGTIPVITLAKKYNVARDTIYKLVGSL